MKKYRKKTDRIMIIGIAILLLGITCVSADYEHGQFWSRTDNTIQTNDKDYNVAIGYDENKTTTYKLDVNGTVNVNDNATFLKYIFMPNGIVLGENSATPGNSNVVIGSGNVDGSGYEGIVLGELNQVGIYGGGYFTLIGSQNIIGDNYDISGAISIGEANIVDGTETVCIGSSNTVNGSYSVNIGSGNFVTGNNTVVIGDSIVFSGDDTFYTDKNTVIDNDLTVENDLNMNNDGSIIKLKAKNLVSPGTDGSQINFYASGLRASISDSYLGIGNIGLTFYSVRDFIFNGNNMILNCDLNFPDNNNVTFGNGDIGVPGGNRDGSIVFVPIGNFGDLRFRSFYKNAGFNHRGITRFWFNPDLKPVDFQISTENTEKALFVDSSNDNFTIGVDLSIPYVDNGYDMSLYNGNIAINSTNGLLGTKLSDDSWIWR